MGELGIVNHICLRYDHREETYHVITRLLIGQYCLPRLLEIVMPAETAKIMVLHNELKT